MLNYVAVVLYLRGEPFTCSQLEVDTGPLRSVKDLLDVKEVLAGVLSEDDYVVEVY